MEPPPITQMAAEQKEFLNTFKMQRKKPECSSRSKGQKGLFCFIPLVLNTPHKKQIYIGQKFSKMGRTESKRRTENTVGILYKTKNSKYSGNHHLSRLRILNKG